MHTRGLAVATMIALAVHTGGLWPQWGTAHAQPGAQAPVVMIDTFQFKPRQLETKEGAKVVWANDDDVQHTVTSGTPEQRTDLFNTTMNGKSARFEFTFAKAGKYQYFCNRHQHMRGEIVVKAP